jgi:hypothetical protein
VNAALSSPASTLTPIEPIPTQGAPVLRCCLCGDSEIPAPPGATATTRFWCRVCVGELARALNIADCRGIRWRQFWIIFEQATKNGGFAAFRDELARRIDTSRTAA